MFSRLIGAAALMALVACGGDDDPVAAADAGASVDSAAPQELPANVAGVPGAVAHALPAAVEALAQADDGTVWATLANGDVGTVTDGSFTKVLGLTASTKGVLEAVRPPLAVTRSGGVVVAEALLDFELCRDHGSVTWIDGTDVTVRELQEAPAFELAVTDAGLVIGTLIEYDWNYYNDPPICLKQQPLSQRLAAIDRTQGTVWTMDLNRPALPPTLAADGRTGWFSDGDRTIVAFDYLAAGAVLWETAVGQDGTKVQASSPALGTDGRLYVAARTQLLALDSGDGAVVWTAEVESADALAGEPVLMQTGVIVVAGTLPGEASGKRIWALFGFDLQGQPAWTKPLGESHLHPATTGFELFGTTVLDGGDILTVTPQQRLVLWRLSGDPAAFEGFTTATPPLPLADGSLLAGFEGGTLFQAKLGSGGLALSGWPRWRGSNRRNGTAP